MDSDRAWELPPPGADQTSTAGGTPGAAAPGQGHQGNGAAGFAPGQFPPGQVPPGQPGWAPPGQVPPPPQPGWAPPGQVPSGQAGWASPGQGQLPPGGYAPGQAGWVPPGQAAYQQQSPAYPGQGWAPGAPVPMQVAAKNPALHALASAFLPGLGSMLADNAGIGALILIIYVVGWFLSIVIIGFPILIGAWIWGIINGHSSAVTWNRKHGIIS
jgi:TM2 domain-containing membrane protein YozV